MKSAFVDPMLPSVSETSLITTEGKGSLSVMVPVRVATGIVALVGFESVTVYVSFASFSRSPWTTTSIVLVVWPGLKVNVPDVAE